MIPACFIIRCGNEKDRIDAIEKYKTELCRAGGIIKDVVILDEASDDGTNDVD